MKSLWIEPQKCCRGSGSCMHRDRAERFAPWVVQAVTRKQGRDGGARQSLASWSSFVLRQCARFPATDHPPERSSFSCASTCRSMCVYVNESCFGEPCFGTGVSPSLNSPSVVAGRRSASAVAAGSIQAVTFPLPPPAQEYCARHRRRWSARSHCATCRRPARVPHCPHHLYRSGGAWGRFRQRARTLP